MEETTIEVISMHFGNGEKLKHPQEGVTCGSDVDDIVMLAT